MFTILHGFLLGIGFILSITFLCFLLVMLIKMNKKRAVLEEFTLALFKRYEQEQIDAERYEELSILKPIMDAYKQGKKPTAELLKPFKVESKSTFNVTEAGGMSFVKKKWIVKADNLLEGTND